MTPEAVMVFAAGLGTRMGELTRDRPKPLIAVAGQPLIDHALDLTAGLRVVVNLHYRAAQMRDHLAGRPVRIADETAQLLETGGGLRAALPLLDADPVFTLNSDAVWRGPNPLHVLADHWQAGMEALLLLLPRERAIGHRGSGDFIVAPDGRLTRGPGLVYSGAQILQTGALGAVPEAAFSLNRVWDGMIARGTLFGVVYDGQWCDVGRPDSIALAEGLLR
jgi:MurNAc alpha-1-phosphate uridylyltransferase